MAILINAPLLLRQRKQVHPSVHFGDLHHGIRGLIDPISGVSSPNDFIVTVSRMPVFK